MAKQSVFEGEVFQSNNFGPFRIVKYVNANEVTVEFINTGYQVNAHTGAIKSGQIKDLMFPSVEGVGYLGVGNYPASVRNEEGKTVTHPFYMLWSGMLMRCYNRKYHMSHVNYVGCSVDKRWHNYQQFCEDIQQLSGFSEWTDYKAYGIGEEHQLDKDKLVEGNKVYSPETCCFLTATENYLIALTNHLKRYK